MTDKYRKVKINTMHDVLHDPENRKKHCVRELHYLKYRKVNVNNFIS